ncbi:Cyclic di-GMP phosphodiesterase response regulator RpfG [Planctomycetes bacterium Pan216]|uniref:Cyclic di-GMP phosphodiesterase response regulator RpfG n=1 Tax=Kolteria novifilia TaxID=2527975 RepID=A0A518BBH6_9BACT|nr:Cyclic di-GMP phosphodiesterase response regulator RpfG [Planctomycetes bacterium Pan216]
MTHALVVDDESFICELIARWLERDGIHCDAACSVEAALEKMASKPYALVISDIGMPGGSGLDLLEASRRRGFDGAFLIMTGVEDKESVRRTFRGNGYGYIVKPLNEVALFAEVHSALRRLRQERELKAQKRTLTSRLRRRSRDLLLREREVAHRLICASTYRDKETGAHIRRIGEFSAVIAAELGWNANNCEIIRIAAMMHDVGKIAIPDGILLKPGPLTPEERTTMEQHTRLGAELLGESDIPMVQMACTIARCHHERWDGTGYPLGMAGDEIPECARIVSVVDVYDALIHRRPYKEPMPEPTAVAYLAEHAGTQFDPRVVDAFQAALDQIREIRRVVFEDEKENRDTLRLELLGKEQKAGDDGSGVVGGESMLQPRHGNAQPALR